MKLIDSDNSEVLDRNRLDCTRQNRRVVVLYNPVLLHTFNVHINVEITSSVKSIRCVCEHITKGND